MSDWVSSPSSLPLPEAFAIERVFPIRSLVTADYDTRKEEDAAETTPAIDPKCPGAIIESLLQDGRGRVSPGDASSLRSKDVDATLASPYMPPPFSPVPPEDAIRRLSSENRDDGSASSIESDGSGTRRTERTEFMPAS